MQVQDYTTDPTLVTVLNFTAPSEMDTETGVGVYYLGDSIVTARPVEETRNHEDFGVPTEWYIESVEGY